MKRGIIIVAAVLGAIGLIGGWATLRRDPPATVAAAPLHVLLIPADGGTESGTLADYRPLFDAVARRTGQRFDLKVAQSYGAVVEGMCNGAADIAFVGPVTYLQARKAGCADLLAIAVTDGRSLYHAGLFVPAASPVSTIADLRGRRVAFGDVNSTSSFVVPVTMLLDAKIDPARDLGGVRLLGSHASSLAALLEGRVDAAALSFESYEKAVREGVPGVRDLRVVARSGPIPYPPLVIGRRVPAATRARLRDAFATIDTAPGIRPEMIRGYGGAQVDRYDTAITPAMFDGVARQAARITPALTDALLRRSGEPAR
jgi:phosphonate transport system substrate-binding protein